MVFMMKPKTGVWYSNLFSRGGSDNDVFMQMSLVGVGDILWALRSTLRTHTPCEGGWLRCRSSSLLVNEWFRRGVACAGSQSYSGTGVYIHWNYGRSVWGTRWAQAQDAWGCRLGGWEPLWLRLMDFALPSFPSIDVCSSKSSFHQYFVSDFWYRFSFKTYSLLCTKHLTNLDMRPCFLT